MYRIFFLRRAPPLATLECSVYCIPLCFFTLACSRPDFGPFFLVLSFSSSSLPFSCSLFPPLPCYLLNVHPHVT
ncbi:hypothetical protein DFJ73DRAFT_848654 [Zopfochytrium polystomum]|nr:hypothetical protein DFJ73DRAFT_848654 [Zopfochytrium polystomum]